MWRSGKQTLSPSSYFTTWNSKAKNTPLPTQLFHFKKIIALFWQSLPRLSLTRGEHLVFPQPRFEQVRSQDGFGSKGLPSSSSNPAVHGSRVTAKMEKNKRENTPTFPDAPSPHTLCPSPSVSLSLDDCINTGKAHSTDAHTHTYIQTPIHSLACLLTRSHTLTSTVLCGQAGG